MLGAFGRVAALWRYPVKSMLGEQLDVAAIEPRGIVGDRAWAVRTAEGKLGSGKTTRRFGRVDGLLEFRAWYEGPTPVVELPSGKTVRGDTSDIDAALSDATGVALTLVAEANVSHFDSGAVHLLTTSSLRWLGSRMGTDAIDPRRFRPNLLLETTGDERVEESWVGRTLRIGGTELQITQRTVRCIMTTLAQNGLVVDPSVLRALAATNDACLGVYANVVRAGSVHVGDTAEPG